MALSNGPLLITISITRTFLLSEWKRYCKRRVRKRREKRQKHRGNKWMFDRRRKLKRKKNGNKTGK